MENNILIHVTPQYRATDSDIIQSRFAFSYKIKIENRSDEIITLRTRTWKITDACGNTENVHGVGVVGEQPTLYSGDCFEYQSGTQLDTPWGSMEGQYEFETSWGGRIEVAIPRFELKSDILPQ